MNIICTAYHISTEAQKGHAGFLMLIVKSISGFGALGVVLRAYR